MCALTLFLKAFCSFLDRCLLVSQLAYESVRLRYSALFIVCVSSAVCLCGPLGVSRIPVAGCAAISAWLADGAVLLPDNLAKETPATNINRQRLIQAITACAYTKKSHNHSGVADVRYGKLLFYSWEGLPNISVLVSYPLLPKSRHRYLFSLSFPVCHL